MKEHILRNAINIIRNLQEDGAGPGPGGAAIANSANAPGTGGALGADSPNKFMQGFTPVMKLDGRSKVMRRLPPQYRQQLTSKKKG